MTRPAVAARTGRLPALLCLMLAGEAIFSLPFHVARFFRPTVLEVFGLGNAALGDAFAVYGVCAMLCYFPGGMLADRWHARGLMSFALLSTAAGGLWFASFPTAGGLKLLYGYWGVTTILPFWAALIRATREWGGAPAQGQAFGLLDAGRGLVAAGLAGIAVSVLGQAMAAAASDADGLRRIILFYTAVTAASAVLAWWLIPAGASSSGRTPAEAVPFTTPAHLLEQLRTALGLPLVWRQAAIVAAAYCGYKGIDNYALYAVEVAGMTELEAARFVANAAWLRPVAALVAGLLADRFRASASLCALFVLAAVSYAWLGMADGRAAVRFVVLANLALSVAAVYGLRGVYFAALEESRVPLRHTGGAVGLISVVGYTPDIFFAPVAGRLLDASPGPLGHRHYFLLLAAIAACGALLSWALYRRLARHAAARPDAIP
jgi:MFS family permease